MPPTPNPFPATIDPQLKKTIYSACHRGIKENDLLLGEFAKDAQQGLALEDLPIFKELLEESDGEIYAWVIAQQKIDQIESSSMPEKYRTIIQKIIEYHDRPRTTD